MIMKRFLCLLLTLTMVISTATAAFAAEDIAENTAIGENEEVSMQETEQEVEAEVSTDVLAENVDVEGMEENSLEEGLNPETEESLENEEIFEDEATNETSDAVSEDDEAADEASYEEVTEFNEDYEAADKESCTEATEFSEDIQKTVVDNNTEDVPETDEECEELLEASNGVDSNGRLYVTEDQAIQWLDYHLGEGFGIQYDGRYQCVGLITQYMADACGARGYSLSGMSYASDMTEKTADPGYDRIPGATPKRGDILIYTGGYGGYGHVAVYGGPGITYHQNAGTDSRLCRKDWDYEYDPSLNYWGVWRPRFRGLTASGSCGTNVSWSLYNDEELTIIGTGAMTTRPCYPNYKSIKTVNIGNGVTSIGDDAFYDCTSLTSISIPNSVTSIGVRAFDFCTSLTSVSIPNSVTSIGYSAFSSCKSLKSISIPNSVTSIGTTFMFMDCTSLTSVSIPNSVTSIRDFAFEGCTSLTSINIPNSVTSIGYSAFSGCKSLKSISIPNSVTSIEYYAFKGCKNLKNITLPIAVCGAISNSDIDASKTKITLTSVVGDKETCSFLNPKGGKAKLTSSKKGIVTISSSKKPKITANKAGTTTVKCKVGKKTYSCKVIVKKPSIVGSSSVKKGKNASYSLSYRNKGDGVKWKSSNKKVATISSKGVLKAKKKGKVKITATYGGKKYTKKITIK